MTEATKERIKFFTELMKLLVTVDIAVAVGVINMLFRAQEGNKIALGLLLTGILFLILFVSVSFTVFLKLKNLVQDLDKNE